MASQADVRRIALSLPGAREISGRFAFGVDHQGKLKAFAWVWMERVVPPKPRVPQPKVLALRVASLDDKEFLIAANPVKFFTEPHYDGFPAILVRLSAVSPGELKGLITTAWGCQLTKDALAKSATPRGRASAHRSR
jgi:hypothetical protein